MAELRECAQCGAPFVPSREHARFCSTACRMTWNAEHNGPDTAPLVAIDWSVSALSESAGRFGWAGPWDLPRAAVAASETVWWITLLDATLVRYHRQDYEVTLAVEPADERRKTEETLAGLRFVRNMLGLSVDPSVFIHRSPKPERSPRAERSARAEGGWIWTPQEEPSLDDRPDTSRDWEMSRYRSYQVRLAGRDVAASFDRCAAFLEQVAAVVTATEDAAR